MKGILGFFSLATDGDVPLGLRSIRQTEKCNQPSFEEQSSYNFVPLFKQIENFLFVEESEEEYSQDMSGLSWFSLNNNC